jgi:hypothetical protein
MDVHLRRDRGRKRQEGNQKATLSCKKAASDPKSSPVSLTLSMGLERKWMIEMRILGVIVDAFIIR